ncbi:MAG: hypothetical protein OXC37_04325 [Bdellovibrionaceae bacterium]|nr:hypothetical protein [Pseudobdellovibrionaceae bacterium]
MKLLLFIFLFPYLTIADKDKIKLDPELKSSYLKLLNQASDFHKALTEENNPKIQKEIKETQEIIAELYRKTSNLEEFHFRIHSYKLLESIQEKLSMMSYNQPLKNDQKKKVVKKLFNSFLELAEVYDLKKEMNAKIFYCETDRSLWFQTNNKGHNPINSSLKNCATQVL